MFLQKSRKRREKKFYRFFVPAWAVVFAGSRYQEVPQSICTELIEAFAGQGFSFYIGCADGVDRSFRRAVARSFYQDRCFVACAFLYRLKYSHSYSLFASVVVPKNILPKAALYRRTIWMVKRCSVGDRV